MSALPSPTRPEASPPAWDGLAPAALPTAAAPRRRLPAVADPASPAAAAFDLLRTRTLAAASEAGWTRIGVTQPRDRAAGAYAALNLALSLARRPSMRVLLVDLDLRHPRLARLAGLERAPALGPALRDGAELAQLPRRIGNLALLANAEADPRASETLLEPAAAASLGRLVAGLEPDVTLLLLPPLLEGDGGLAGLALVDTSLMVIDAGRTLPGEIRACDRLDDGGAPPILGLVLVEAEG